MAVNKIEFVNWIYVVSVLITTARNTPNVSTVFKYFKCGRIYFDFVFSLLTLLQKIKKYKII